MIMKVKSLFLVVLCIFLTTSLSPVQASGITPSNPVNYKTEIKVKLLPTETISFKMNGMYEIINLDDNTVIPYSSWVSVIQKEGAVNLIVGEENFASLKGFDINEIQYSNENEVEVSNINTASGVAPVKYRGSLEIRPGSTGPNLFNTLDMEDYLKGVVPSEMPASWPIEALKAQTVAARSYAYTQLQNSRAKGYLEMTVSNQVYGGKSKEHENSNRAIQETAGIYATYNNVPINAFFHSSSGGHTENAEDVWSDVVPYIKGVPDPYDNNNGNKHYGWEIVGNADSIERKLYLTNSQTLLGLTVTERTPSDAVQQMEAIVYDESTDTTTSVKLLPKYASNPDRFRSLFGITLKSIRFDIAADSSQKIKLADGTEKSVSYLKGVKIKEADGSESPLKDVNLSVKTSVASKLVPTSPQEFTFTGDGWGHLIGMSQWGARGMAEKGYAYDEIVKHYFTGVEVKTIN